MSKNRIWSWRIIRAIAAKDIVDAIKNRTTITLILGAVSMMFTSQALPMLLNRLPTPYLAVYEVGDSSLTAALAESDQFQLSVHDSQEEMEEHLIGVGARMVGIVVPADFDDALAEGRAAVDGYVVWANRRAAAELATEAEARLADLMGQPVEIDMDGHIVYLQKDSPGTTGLFAGMVIMVILLVGGFVVSHLMIEEKQTKTIDALLVSPASIMDVVLGKALAGLFYCLAAVAVAIAFSWTLVTHWGLVVLVLLVASVVSVAVGLLMGVLFDNAQQMGLWIGLPFFLLLIPTLIVDMGLTLPRWIELIASWLPTTVLVSVLRLSFSGGATVMQALPQLAVTLGIGVILYLILAWQVHRLSV